jgi:ParB family chromosome partitioning protein
VLKTWPEPFAAMHRGAKTAEFRKNDRDFQIGDVLFLREWDPLKEEFTGQELYRFVTHVVRGPDFDIPEGYAVMSIRKGQL